MDRQKIEYTIKELLTTFNNHIDRFIADVRRYKRYEQLTSPKLASGSAAFEEDIADYQRCYRMLKNRYDSIIATDSIDNLNALLKAVKDKVEEIVTELIYFDRFTVSANINTRGTLIATPVQWLIYAILTGTIFSIGYMAGMAS